MSYCQSKRLRSTLIRSRDRHEKEMRAIDRLLGAARAADAQTANFDADVRHLREQLRREEVELDSLGKRSNGCARRRLRPNRGETCRSMRSESCARESNSSRMRAIPKRTRSKGCGRRAERDRSSWAEHRTRLESQVVQHADMKQDEFKQRIGRKARSADSGISILGSLRLEGNTVSRRTEYATPRSPRSSNRGGLPIRARD